MHTLMVENSIDHLALPLCGPMFGKRIRNSIASENQSANYICSVWMPLHRFGCCYFQLQQLSCWSNTLCDLRIVSRMILLWLLATCRFAYVVGEQPRNSAMLIFPYLVFFKRVVRRFAMNSWLESFLSVPHLTL